MMHTDIKSYFEKKGADGLTPAEELYQIRKRRANAADRLAREPTLGESLAKITGRR